MIIVSRTAPSCAGSLLNGGPEHLVDVVGQRVCIACRDACRQNPFLVPRERARIVSEPVGVWSKAREFYSHWQLGQGVNVPTPPRLAPPRTAPPNPTPPNPTPPSPLHPHPIPHFPHLTTTQVLARRFPLSATIQACIVEQKNPTSGEVVSTFSPPPAGTSAAPCPLPPTLASAVDTAADGSEGASKGGGNGELIGDTNGNGNSCVSSLVIFQTLRDAKTADRQLTGTGRCAAARESALAEELTCPLTLGGPRPPGGGGGGGAGGGGGGGAGEIHCK